ncbi:MAG: hypothetical protein E7501_01905 [Ruminococcus sp.]|nr:hypothetical protein [Ruminococcus sp.]
MKRNRILCLLTAVLLGGACWMTGCDEKTESPAVDDRGIPLELQLIYDSAAVTDAHAQLISDYFTAIQNRDFSAYSELIYPGYYSEMEVYLQENYNYGMEQSFEKRVDMLAITDENHFRFTQIKMEPAAEDSFEAYLTSMDQVMGEDFSENIRSGMDEYTILMFSVNAISDDMEHETTVVDNNEMIIATSGGKAYLFG